jgi:protein-S-isoprenylcysteine O-methyltransferase Ste14
MPVAAGLSAGRRIALAAGMGLATHASFLAAVGSMSWSLATGMRAGLGRVDGAWGLVADLVLALQFPVIHSWLLSARGARWLAPARLGEVGRTLSTSSFALAASMQVLATFWLWTPSNVVLHRAGGLELTLQPLLVASAWIFLAKAIRDDDSRVQSGFLGWSSLLRGRQPCYRGFPRHGLYSASRHPIYLGFLMCLWVGPVLTFDKLLLGTIWSGYCVLGPRLKERRYLVRYGEPYSRYRASVPYLLPRLSP